MLFRLQIALTFIISIGAVAAVGYLTHQNTLRAAIEEDTARSIQRAARIAARERALDEAALTIKASAIASDPKLTALMVDPYEGKADQKYERHIAAAQRLRVWEIILQKRGEGRKDLPNDQLPPDLRRPHLDELAFIVDREGVGVAALGKDLLKWHGDDVAGTHPQISVAMSEQRTVSAFMEWTYTKEAGPQLYQVIIAPIRPTPNDRTVGAVVLGKRISQGMAQAIRRNVAGLSELKKDGNLDQLESPHIAIYLDGKIVASSLPTSEQKTIGAAVMASPDLLKPESTHSEIKHDNKDFYAYAVPFPQYVSEKPSGVVAITAMERPLKPLKNPGTYTIVTAIVCFLLGSILMILSIQMFIKPIADIEEGILKILSGNKDYEFEPASGNPLATGLAQQLNNMSAYLQGKRMPDDEDGGGNWGDLAGGSGAGSGQRSGAAPRVQGVSMADLMNKKPASPSDDS